MQAAPHAELNIAHARERMVYQQVRTWAVLNPQVLKLMCAMPRERFVPEQYRDMAFADMKIPLDPGHEGRREVMFMPKMEGRVLQALNLTKDDRVLEIGTGSGFLTACLASLAGEVHSVDIHAPYIASAQACLHDLGIRNVTCETRDASRLDWVKTPYDAIVVTGSMPELEPGFLHALAIGGRLFAVAGKKPVMEALLITRTADDDWTRESLFETVIPPLVNAWEPQRFEF